MEAAAEAAMAEAAMALEEVVMAVAAMATMAATVEERHNLAPSKSSCLPASRREHLKRAALRL